MSENSSNEPVNYHDDNRVLRYVLKNVKGTSPVWGGVLGDALENEYEVAEEEVRIGEDFDIESDVV